MDVRAFQAGLLAHAAAIRRGVALAGFALVLWVLWRLPGPGEAAPPWVWRVFVARCAGVPYWHHLERRFLLDPAADERTRREFAALQTLSRAVWFGVAAVLAVALLRR